jgi:subtilisin
MLVVLALLACSSPEVADAGDPADLASFDPQAESLFSDLADAGYDAVPGQYLVLVDDGDGLSRAMDRAHRDLAAVVPAAVVVQELEQLPILTVQMTHEEALELARQPRIVAVEPDWIATLARPTFGSACATSSAETVPAGVAAMGSNAADGAGIAVAVLDTGIDTSHGDLSVAGLVDFTGSRGGGVDDNGHGTHVAGSIAAVDDANGVIGVAPAVDLYGVKVLDRRGSGAYSVIAAGLDWSVSNGMDVVNMSLGGTYDSTVLHAAVTRAHGAGVIQVVAAGNSGIDASREFPAGYASEVITVSAYNVAGSGSWPSWSNYGSVVDIAAPGVSVCSTTKGGGWGTMDGTSMASPHVAGAAAVYLENHPTASFSSVVSALKSSATTLANTSRHSEDLANVTGL